MNTQEEHEALWDLDRDEAEKKLDALLDALRIEGRQDEVRWAVEVICDEFLVPLYPGSDEPVEDVDLVAKSLTAALIWHGERCTERRSQMQKVVLGHLREVLSILEEWGEGSGRRQG